MTDRTPSPIHQWNDETRRFEITGYGVHVYSPPPIWTQLSPASFAEDDNDVSILLYDDDDEYDEYDDDREAGEYGDNREAGEADDYEEYEVDDDETNNVWTPTYEMVIYQPEETYSGASSIIPPSSPLNEEYGYSTNSSFNGK